MEGSGWGPTQGVGKDAGFAEPHTVELIGSQLRAAGSLRTPSSSHLSDFVSFPEGFFCIQDVVLRARSGAPTRARLPGRVARTSPRSNAASW